jgi:hypothetical protein
MLVTHKTIQLSHASDRWLEVHTLTDLGNRVLSL